MQRKIIIVIGPSGAGKTATVSKLINEYHRVAVFDIVKDEQYTTRKDVIVVEGRPLQFAQATNAVTGGNRETPFKVVYHPVKVKVMDNNAAGLVEAPEFEPIVKVCHERGDMVLVIDEAHLLTNSYNCPPELMMVNLVGRHKGVSLVLVTQSFTGIHPAIRKNADEFYFWKMIEPSEIDGIKDRCGKDVAEQVRNLRPVEVDEDLKFKRAGQRLHWSKFKGVVEVTE